MTSTPSVNDIKLFIFISDEERTFQVLPSRISSSLYPQLIDQAERACQVKMA
jgi:hypothetical protein